jgi:hypothetical protein
MARGWESKDVESQVEAKKSMSASPSTSSSRGPKTPEELRREQECRDLQLSRIRIVNDLQVATNPNHRKSLEAALAHLDQKIAQLS